MKDPLQDPLETIRGKKHQLEQRIKELMEAFERDTGAAITDIKDLGALAPDKHGFGVYFEEPPFYEHIIRLKTEI